MGTLDSRGIYTPAALETGWDDELATNFALFDTIVDRNTAITAAIATHLAATDDFNKSAAWLDPAGIAASTLMVVRFNFACTLTALRGYRVGGTTASIQGYRNTTGTTLSSSAVALGTASTWTAAGSVQNTAFASGDSLLLAITSVTGTVTQVTVQADFTRP